MFLSMGEDLQNIVCAAKHRPNLNDENVYVIFKQNIESHICSMADTATEHLAFYCMRQEMGESAMNFHARLMEKAVSL